MECENTFEKKWSFPPYILRVTSIKKLFTVLLFEAKLIVSAVVILRRFVVYASNFWDFDITLSRWDSIYRYPPFTAHLHYEKSYLILLILIHKNIRSFSMIPQSICKPCGRYSVHSSEEKKRILSHMEIKDASNRI